jgi:NAD(P)-dependent dehydrogenase (short-subunit alcohol dehydrogenase family)
LKTVVVTGSAQGVGLATASLLARSEYRVILLDIQPVDEHVDRMRAAGAQVAGLSGDISSEAFVQQLAQWIHREYGAADGLVNNAGISHIAPAEETSAAEWQRVMDINLFGPFLLCKYLGAQMLERGRGSIVNVASVAGLAAVSHRSAYNASKHGLIGLTKTLASEWGGRGAYSDTDIVNRVPMARFARADDVAEAIAFLLDHKRGGFVNGVSLPVDGGWTADASWESLRMRTRT